MSMNVEGLRPSVAWMPIPKDRFSKTKFGAQLKQAAAQASPAADTVEVSGMAADTPFYRKELTRAELKEFAAGLSEKYDPRSMTQEDYDSFLEDLMAEGLLSMDEVKTLGYHNLVVFSKLGGGACFVETKTLKANPYFQRYGYVNSLQDTNGDALAYASLRSLWKDPHGTEGFLDLFEKQNTGYTIMAEVLGAMDKCR